MLRQLMSKFTRGAAPAVPHFTPYADGAANALYDLLFCDDLAPFRRPGAAQRGPLATLLAENPDIAVLRQLADTRDMESRVRALAFLRLRQIGLPVVPKIVLGAVIEVRLGKGLDVLAAYADGRVRYLNQSGKVSIFEGGPATVESLARETIQAAQLLIRETNPSTQTRQAPPQGEHARLSFLVSDGLYVSDGPFAQLQRDRLTGPVLAKGGQLLSAVVDAALKKH